MAIRIAIGNGNPFLYPGTYPDVETAITQARSMFQIWGAKVPVSVWNTDREFTLVNGECIEAINPVSWEGPRDRESGYDGIREPGPLPLEDTPQELTETEYLLVRQYNYDPDYETEAYGPVLVDGNFYLTKCQETVKVYWDVDGQGRYGSLANRPYETTEPVFLWKHRSYPVGFPPPDWTEPHSAEFTVPLTIPGLDYKVEVTDKYLDLEE